MQILSKPIHVFVIILLISSVQSQGNLNKETQKLSADKQTKLNEQKMKDIRSQINKLNNQIEKGLNAQAQSIVDFKNLANKRIQQLEELGKEIHAWNQVLKKINQYVTMGNNVMASFNEKVTTVMTKMIGFQEQIKAVVSLDTLVVCILSLVLVKILKDEFIDEGYQPVSNSLRPSSTQMSSSVGLQSNENVQ